MLSARREALALLAAAGVLGACTSGIQGRRPERAPALPPTLHTRAALRYAIDSMIADPQFRNAHWGVLIVHPATGDTLYSHNAGKLFMPASNQKLLTSAVALAQLGPDFRFRTTFAVRPFTGGPPVRDGVLYGDLVVIGRGDPTVSDHMLGDAMLPLRAAADSLAARGVRRVAGRLVRGGDAFPDANYG